MTPDLEVQVHADPATTAAAAAACIATAAGEALARRGVFTLALSGGRTPALMLSDLARRALPWDRVHVFQVDERVAPDGDPARNFQTLAATLVEEAGIPAGNVHPMPVTEADLDAAAGRYAERLGERAGVPPVLDLVHLGLGDDGHTASLVPGDAALEVRDRDVCTTAEYRGHRRMTLTYPALDRARCRLWLLTGADKAPMLARLRGGDADIPAGRVARRGAIVFCDRPAAGE